MSKNKPGRPTSGTRKTPGSARAVGKPTEAQKRLSSQRADAARQRIAADQRRRRLIAVAASAAGVLAVVAVLVVVKVTTGAGGPSSGKAATAASSTVLAKVAGVPATTLDAVGVGTARTSPTAITAPPLTAGGRPEVLYVGAEYCPYCAAERWAVAVALSRFGTLHGIGETHSSASDVYPSTATLSFHGATYTSSLLSFVAREIQGNQVVNGQYAPLDKLTAEQDALVKKYDAPPYVKGSSGAIPFIDIGGKYIVSGASYDPGVLQGKSHEEIASALADPTSKIARAVDGTANYLTATLCSLTGNQPSAVCTSQAVTAAAAKLAGSK